mmetsp:Transcript_3722/g.10758  ORF Transcript_3722/g.10758 Transcript_3722/m.10758 type:complete len:584 (+) Transcript_3722:45-1796(+)
MVACPSSCSTSRTGAAPELFSDWCGMPSHKGQFLECCCILMLHAFIVMSFRSLDVDTRKHSILTWRQENGTVCGFDDVEGAEHSLPAHFAPSPSPALAPSLPLPPAVPAVTILSPGQAERLGAEPHLRKEPGGPQAAQDHALPSAHIGHQANDSGIGSGTDPQGGIDLGETRGAGESPAGILPMPQELPRKRGDLLAREPAVPRRCPRVFTYRLKAPFVDSQVPKDGGVFGPGFLKGSKEYRLTNQYELAQIYHYRLTRPNAACRTEDPASAELFFVPWLTAPKGTTAWGSVCRRTANRSSELAKQLPYLNSSTAYKHFLIVSKGVANAMRCFGIFNNPIGLFSKVARLQYQVRFTPEDLRDYPEIVRQQAGWPALNKHVVSEQLVPRVYTVPYPSMFHWDGVSAKPWASTAPRSTLALYLGGFNHGDELVRRAIKQACGRGGLRCARFGPGSIADLAKSTFLLQPIGDTIGRKSTMDGYSLGCIPVFFGNAQMFQYPEIWEGWHRNAFVTIDRLEFIRNPQSLMQSLRLIPKGKVKKMQRSIAQHGIKFTYGLVDPPAPQEDAIGVMLRHLWVDALNLSSSD